MVSLTFGVLKRILQNGETANSQIVKILKIKNIQKNSDYTLRYKLKLFDGESEHKLCVLDIANNKFVANEFIKSGTLIRLQEYRTQLLSDPFKTVIILIKFEIINETSSHFTTEINQSNNKTSITNISNSTKSSKEAVCISTLSLWEKKWTIKVRCSYKSGIRTWKKDQKEGKVFDFGLFDASGQIKAAGFNEQCDTLYDMLIKDKVYYISNGFLKLANKMYSKENDNFEMTITKDTLIEQCDDDSSIPLHPRISFCLINDCIKKKFQFTISNFLKKMKLTSIRKEIKELKFILMI